jgi:hypothetical protein
LLLVFFPAGFAYLYVAMKRADRTALCTLDHAALQRAREEENLRELSRMLDARHQPRPTLLDRINAETEAEARQ